MPELGKIDREFFDEIIYPHLGDERDDVVLGPQHGVDFGVIEVGDKMVAMATDPVFIMPSLGFERAAWFAFHILFSDVAVSGLNPSHLSIDFNLPPEITDDEFKTVWQTFDEEARDLGVSVVTGHTARYAGCNYPMVGGGTAVAVGDKDDLVTPTSARPGDRLIITKGPAVEATALLTVQFESLMDLPQDTIQDAKDRFYDMSPVQDALTASRAGPVTAMHDATESGVYGGLHELARASDVRLDVERDRIPVLPGIIEACGFFGIDPWISISEGTLVMTVAPEGVDDVLKALDDANIPAADVGKASEGSGVYVDSEEIDHPGYDPFWGAFEEYMEKLQAE
ncbi:MAG: AIR synthase family protein [Halobacteria archaeon]|nr:AIR synthase family protein [Halobacteria archaeon]